MVAAAEVETCEGSNDEGAAPEGAAAAGVGVVSSSKVGIGGMVVKSGAGGADIGGGGGMVTEIPTC